MWENICECRNISKTRPTGRAWKLYGTGSTRVPGLLLRYGRISNRPVPLHLPPIFRESDAPGYWIRSLLPLGIKTSSSISAASLKSKKRHRLGLQVCTREYAPNQNKNGQKRRTNRIQKNRQIASEGFQRKPTEETTSRRRAYLLLEGARPKNQNNQKTRRTSQAIKAKKNDQNISTGPGKIWSGAGEK